VIYVESSKELGGIFFSVLLDFFVSLFLLIKLKWHVYIYHFNNNVLHHHHY